MNSKFVKLNSELILCKEYSFADVMEKYLCRKGFSDIDAMIIKNSFLTKEYYYKLKSKSHIVNPSKITCLQLAIGLRLNIKEMEDFLFEVGYSLNRDNKLDRVFIYAIEHKIYDGCAIFDFLQEIDVVNENGKLIKKR